MTGTDADLVALGRALRILRRRADLTQAEVGKRVGIRNTHVSAVERGERGLSYRTLIAMLRAYKATLRDLVDEMDRGDV